MLRSLPRPNPSTLLVAVLALVATAPAWVVDYPPVMDWPFHLATLRVVADFSDPAFGFSEDFVLTLGRTQYVLFYVLGTALSWVLGVKGAMMALVAGYLGGTVLGLSALLRALGRDPRGALLVIPLLPNVLFYYGLFPFLIGIPLIFAGLALAIGHFDALSAFVGPDGTRSVGPVGPDGTRSVGPVGPDGPRSSGAGVPAWRALLPRALGLLCVSLALFFTHAFPFLIFGLGFTALFPWRTPRRWLLAGLPVAPALLAAVVWATTTEAGRLSLGALTDAAPSDRLPLDAALADIPNWLMNALASTRDDALFLAFLALLALAVVLSLGDRSEPAADRASLAEPAHQSPASPSPWRLRAYALLPLLCAVLYFRSPQGHGYLWLIAQRFPVLFLITALPLVPIPRGRLGHLIIALSAALGLASTASTVAAFVAFARDDVGDFDAALSRIPPRARVAALIHDRQSATTNGRFAPFLHFGSWVQAEKGGVVMFTYAGYAHWPFDFAPGRAPPGGAPARLRWEWTPERVSPDTELAPYYTHVLVRGDRFRPGAAPFARTYDGDRWEVWENTALQPRTPPSGLSSGSAPGSSGPAAPVPAAPSAPAAEAP